jgi:hypothetical protein
MLEDNALFYHTVASVDFFTACKIVWARIRYPYLEIEWEKKQKELEKLAKQSK